jgi:hypothetical protein
MSLPRYLHSSTQVAQRAVPVLPNAGMALMLNINNPIGDFSLFFFLRDQTSSVQCATYALTTVTL